MVKAENLVISEDKERNTLVADTKRVTEKLKRILDASKGKLVIDGHYAVEVVQKEIITIVFVLRRDPRELKRILEERGYSEKKVWENLGAEILDVCLSDAIAICGVNKVCEIDVTEKTLDSTVEEMLFIINEKQGCRIGVDWLRRLENAGQLEDFIRKLILS
jgi:adenylate kinase